jgi:hypothetical protein
VTAPTTITRAFDFSDNLAGIGGVQHRVYGMQNDRFADAFEQANADRMWTDALRVRSARREGVAITLLVAAVLAAAAIIVLR